jgi:hypothetical protein
MSGTGPKKEEEVQAGEGSSSSSEGPNKKEQLTLTSLPKEVTIKSLIKVNLRHLHDDDPD